MAKRKPKKMAKAMATTTWTVNLSPNQYKITRRPIRNKAAFEKMLRESLQFQLAKELVQALDAIGLRLVRRLPSETARAPQKRRRKAKA